MGSLKLDQSNSIMSGAICSAASNADALKTMLGLGSEGGSPSIHYMFEGNDNLVVKASTVEEETVTIAI